MVNIVLGPNLPQKIIGILAFLLLSSIACGIGSRAQIGPPEGTIPVSEEAANRLKNNFNQALQETTVNNESQLRITNEEITSLVAMELTQTGQIPVTDPQVWFTSGRIFMAGEVTALGVSNSSITVATAVVDNGRLVVEVQEAKMGPFDFPDSMLESITQTINESLAGILLDLEITRLEILEGEMFVMGTRRIP